MKRARMQPQNYQEQDSSSTTSSSCSSIFAPSSGQSLLSLPPSLFSSTPQMPFQNMTKSLFTNGKESSPLYALKVICILTVLGATLWTLESTSHRFVMDRTSSLRGYSSGLDKKPRLFVENPNRTGSISIAHLGNSIQYFNDCPRMLEHMMLEQYATVTQDSCLKGGANVTSLYQKGNGMQHKFATPNALLENGKTFDIGSPMVDSLLAPSREWDYVIINDHTQAPARKASKADSIQTFKEKYIPLLEQRLEQRQNLTVILLMTAAYKSPAKNSSDLGGFDQFTKLLVEGYAEYATLFSNVKICPLGLAYQCIKEQKNETTAETPLVSWEALYAPDDFHPSPHGTYLEACLLYCTITGQVPPEYNLDWWSTARYMQPPMSLPTPAEAEYLRNVASQVCNITTTASSAL